jgi:tRNA dimethylallyltransferase
MVGVWLPRDVLNRHIDRRLAAMPALGLVEEVAALRARRAGIARTAGQAIGYQEVLAHLAGDCTLDDALAVAATRTRQFARRQRMWFRRDPRIAWIAAGDGAGEAGGNPDVLSPVLLAKWSR